jgi:2-aminoadipate transaminase
MNIQAKLSRRALGLGPSPIRELLKFMKIEGMISLGGGYPNPDTFAFERINIEFKGGRRVTIEGSDLAAASQYGPSDAHGPLKRQLIEWHRRKDGVALEESRIVVLNGSQEGLFIMAYLFANAEDGIIVCEPTYPGALTAFRAFTKNFVAIPLDAEGMNTGVLEEKLARIEKARAPMPKFIYTIPSGHNPGGVALSGQRREHMIRLANRHDLLVLEDDPYQLIKLEDTPLLPTLQSLDTEQRVVRLDSFSKIFAPGLRLGYASGSEEIMRCFVLFKQASNLHTSMFIQELLRKYLEAHTHEEVREHIAGNCRIYRNNRDAMLDAASRHLPPDVKYNIPRAGMFIWFELPASCDAKRMTDAHCERLKVLLVPGGAFSTQDGCRNCMRASFSLVTPAEIEEGIRRFGEMIRLEMSK